MSSLSAFLSFDDAVDHEEERGLAIPATGTSAGGGKADNPTAGTSRSSSLASSLSASPSVKLRQMGSVSHPLGADVHAKPTMSGSPAWDTTKEGSIWDEVIRSQEHMQKSSKGFEVIHPTFGEPNPAEAAVQTSAGHPEMQRFLSSDPPPKSNKKDNLAQFESGADLHKRSWPAKEAGAARWDKTQSGSIWDEIIKSQQYMKK